MNELTTDSVIKPIIPKSREDLEEIAADIFDAGLAPDSYKAPTREESLRRIKIGIMKGLEVGYPPMAAMSWICIINGRPSIICEGAMALIQSRGLVDWAKDWIDRDGPIDDWTAHCEIKRKGQPEPFKGRFSVADAKRAHLWANPKKRPWIEYPQRMLIVRAKSWAIRDGFADALGGLAIAEEVQDMPMKDITPPDTSFLDDERLLESAIIGDETPPPERASLAASPLEPEEEPLTPVPDQPLEGEDPS